MARLARLRELKNDREQRARALLYFTLAVNLAYALLQTVNGIAARSVWAGTLAFYYLTLSAMRFSLLFGHKKADEGKKWRKYRGCASIMLLLNFALLGIHCVTVYMGHTIEYPGYMIYAMAAYTFYAAIMAVRNVVVFRRLSDPILSAGKAVSLAAAAISVYSLQSAMISAFGDGDSPRFRHVMGNCVAAAVFVLISAMSVYMIVRSTRAIKNAK